MTSIFFRGAETIWCSVPTKASNLLALAPIPPSLHLFYLSFPLQWKKNLLCMNGQFLLGTLVASPFTSQGCIFLWVYQFLCIPLWPGVCWKAREGKACFGSQWWGHRERRGWCWWVAGYIASTGKGREEPDAQLTFSFSFLSPGSSPLSWITLTSFWVILLSLQLNLSGNPLKGHQELHLLGDSKFSQVNSTW